MSELIKRFFRFLLPIFRVAVVQVAADVLTKLAYPESYTRRPVRVNRYYAPRTKRQAIVNVGRAMRDVEELGKFHDVLLVAFDVSGRSAHDTHKWIQDNMPEPGEHGDSGEIYLDSWWVANDQRFDGSDTDSAVFVSKGNQKEARELLNKHGLVDSW